MTTNTLETQLLCTFCSKKNLNTIVEEIKTNYNVTYGKIYVLQNEEIPAELICTYNVIVDSNLDYNSVPGTITLHRKKHTNTLYTINGLNETIRNLNNGVLDTMYRIPWENFRNTILVANDQGLNKISTRIFQIINLKE